MPAAVGREAIEHHLGRASNWVHLTMNPIIEIDGDTATQDVMLLFGYRRDDRKDCGIIATARYEDKLVRTPDGWKFTERRCFNDLDPEITFQRLPELLR
jgi:hypothetical protein